MPSSRAPEIPGKATGQYDKQGHTAAPVFGSDPNVQPMGKVADRPRNLKP